MRQIQAIPLVVLGAALVVALACANPAGGKPEAVVGEAREDSVTGDTGRTFVVGDGSTIGFVGSKVTGSHEGGFNAFNGEITMVDNDPTRSNVRIEIDTTSLWANNEKLTGHLKSADFFDVESYPVSTFESTAIDPADGGYTITGNLELHGVTKSISFPATIEVGEGQVTASAEFSIKRFDFGIAYKGKADDLIRDDVLIKLELVATPE